MTDTPPGMLSSWVDLTSELDPPAPRLGHATPPGHWCSLRSGPSTPPYLPSTPPHLLSSDHMRLLRDAQSAGSSLRNTPLGSAMVSRCTTCRNSGTTSPKSPPNSPNVELAHGDSLEVFYINRVEGPGPEVIEEFLWDWSSLPTSTPPKWPKRCRAQGEGRKEEVPYSGRGLTSLLVSNLVSLLLGAGLGVWLYRRTGSTRGIHILL